MLYQSSIINHQSSILNCFPYRYIFFFSLLFSQTSHSSIPSSSTIPIDIVVCMDLSGSTNGVVLNLRERIWDVINEVNTFNPVVNLRIGIVAYSRTSYGKNNYFVKVIADLSDDFDFVEGELLAVKITTDQGEQYVGHALGVAVNNMSWSKESNAIKMIFIAGNGIVNLGGSNEHIEACEKAVKQGIIINAVYCKTYSNIREFVQWQSIAELGKGTYYEIDINKKTAVIPTSCDESSFRDLSNAFNSTYVYYGSKGVERFATQAYIDELMLQTKTMAFQSRFATKISKYYQEKNSAWDLVDLMNTQGVDYSKIDRNTLPDDIKHLNDNDLKKYVERKWSERRRCLSDAKYSIAACQETIKKKRKEQKINESTMLCSVIIDAVDKLAIAKGIKH